MSHPTEQLLLAAIATLREDVVNRLDRMEARMIADHRRIGEIEQSIVRIKTIWAGALLIVGIWGRDLIEMVFRR